MSDNAFDRVRKSREERTGKVPGNDLTDDTEWFMEGVDELPVVSLDGLTVDLVGPAGIVSDGGNGEGDVRVPRPLEGFA